jgi:hypothetical protein
LKKQILLLLALQWAAACSQKMYVASLDLRNGCSHPIDIEARHNTNLFSESDATSTTTRVQPNQEVQIAWYHVTEHEAFSSKVKDNFSVKISSAGHVQEIRGRDVLQFIRPQRLSWGQQWVMEDSFLQCGGPPAQAASLP